MAAARHRFGTNIRNSIDAENFRKAARSVGADLRYWVSNGTVATVDTETGEWNPKDTNAIWNASDGIAVDVKLEPLEIPVTCQYAGIQAGELTILAPIRPGDLVKCEFPDGDLTGGIITNILHSRSNRQPTDGGKPIFGNDRLLIYAKTVPIDIRLQGAAGATPVRVLLEQDGTVTVTGDNVTVTGGEVVLDSSDVRLGGASATEQSVLGTTQALALTTLLGLIAAAFTEISTSIGSAASATAAAGCATFVGELQTMLSNSVKVAQ